MKMTFEILVLMMGTLIARSFIVFKALKITLHPNENPAKEIHLFLRTSFEAIIYANKTPSN